MKFRQFITTLSHRLGQHQIPVNDDAHDIHSFLRADGVHHDVVTDLVKRIYRSNACGHLDAQIDRSQTLHTLAETRREVLAAADTDICRYRLIEELCLLAQDLLPSSDHGSPRLQDEVSRTG